MRIVKIRAGRTPVLDAQRYDGPKRSLALGWYFRPRLPVILLVIAAGYVWLLGWPSVLWEYDYREVYGERHMISCQYWNPSEGAHWRMSQRGTCPFFIGGRNADND